MGSVSKQFTAFTFLRLAKEHKIALTDSVRKYIPELPPYAERITLYQLLTHTSGLRDYFTLGMLSGLPQEDTTYSDDLVLRMLSRQQGLNFEPGTRFLYSNSGYVLLSIVVKRVTGRPLNEVARKLVFGPLGMTTTLFQHDHSALVENKAFGYDFRDAWHAFNSVLDVVGDGGLYSSVDDMLRWMANFDSPRLDADSLITMQAPAKLTNGNTIQYGMGLYSGAYRGLKVVEHGGGLAGYRTEDIWFPSERLAVVVLCNSAEAEPALLARQVSDVYRENALQPTSAPAVPNARLDEKPDAARPSPEQIKAYEGKYYSPELDVTYEVSDREGGLKVHYPGGDINLHLVDKDLFAGPLIGSVKFNCADSGPCAALTIDDVRALHLRFVRISAATFGAEPGG
jgi:CubicO group peptidase (beta-lactamase class C family)